MEMPPIAHEVQVPKLGFTIVLLAFRQLTEEEQQFYATNAYRMAPKKFKRGKVYQVPLFSLLGD